MNNKRIFFFNKVKVIIVDMGTFLGGILFNVYGRSLSCMSFITIKVSQHRKFLRTEEITLSGSSVKWRDVFCVVFVFLQRERARERARSVVCYSLPNIFVQYLCYNDVHNGYKHKQDNKPPPSNFHFMEIVGFFDISGQANIWSSLGKEPIHEELSFYP